MQPFLLDHLLESLRHPVAVAVLFRPSGYPQKLIELHRLRHSDRADDALQAAVRIGRAKILPHAFMLVRRAWIANGLPEIVIREARPLAMRPQEAER